MTLHVITWVWGAKYGPRYVDRLRAGIARHLPQARFLVATPPPADEPLTRQPGCFARLRTFDPAWQSAHGIAAGERIVVLDLDLVVTRSLAGLFDRPEPFAILQGINSVNPNPYNGSVWQLRAGYRPDVWTEFTLERAAALPYYAFPDDQAWFERMLPGAGAFGPAQGVYGFMKRGWPPGAALPSNARIVAFPGARDPSQFVHLDWVREHWADAA